MYALSSPKLKYDRYVIHVKERVREEIERERENGDIMRLLPCCQF